MSVVRFTCPGCGHGGFGELSASYGICEGCFFEDDGVQLLDPSFPREANKLSLMECQSNYKQFGASVARFVNRVRPGTADEGRDLEWRPARTTDLERARMPGDLSDEESLRVESWYYRKR